MRRRDLRIADGVEPHLVELAQRIERIALQLVIDSGRVGKIKHGVAAGAKLHAGVDGRQEARAPVGVASRRALLAGGEDDEAGQVARLRAEPVRRPGAERGPPELLRSGVHQDLARSVVERVRRHAFDDGDVVDDVAQVRQQLRELRAGFAIAAKLEFRTQQSRVGVDERRPIAFEELRGWQLAVVLRQLGFVVEELQVAWAAGHEEVDDALGLGRKMGPLGR